MTITPGHVFRIERDMIDVTSLNRPDTSWAFVDAQGHEHRWHVDGKPAESYSPMAQHELPTLVKAHDGWEYDEDGERFELWHHECAQCGETIKPRFCADDNVQYIPGLQRYSVDDRPVSREVFMTMAREAFPNAKWTEEKS